MWWLATAVLSVATFATVDDVTASAAAEQRRWGDTVEVPVARRAIAAGAVIEAGDVERRRLPRRLVPGGTVAVDPVGQTARVPLWPGEVVLAERVAPAGLRGVAAMVPEGSRGLAVPRGPGTPPLEIGDRVDVLATFDVAVPAEGVGASDSDASVPAPTFPVARDAVVLHLAEEAVTVAVTVDESARVAFALARGSVSLALAGL